jgi:hypothetical protein
MSSRLRTSQAARCVASPTLVTSGSKPASVAVDTTAGSASLVYQVDRTGGVVTVSAVDVSTGTGRSTFANELVAGALVKVFAIPQPDGSLKAYVVTFYTGSKPTS